MQCIINIYKWFKWVTHTLRSMLVWLSSDLSWNSHITAICTKANQKLGFIKRNLKGTPQELKCLAYIAFVRSGMEYAGIIWDPHIIKDSDSMDRVQRRAARWIPNKHDPNKQVLLQYYISSTSNPLKVKKRLKVSTFIQYTATYRETLASSGLQLFEVAYWLAVTQKNAGGSVDWHFSVENYERTFGSSDESSGFGSVW